MGKSMRRWGLLAACVLLLLSGVRQTFSDPALDESRKLLQKSLTVYEIDQEIARLSSQETKLAGEIEASGATIEKKGEQVDETRRHAGKVLRAYYMGERDSIWMLMFSAKSFADALVVYDYLSMIMENDERSLVKYQTAYSELLDMHKQLEATQTDLINVKNEFIKQRERAVALQKELDEQLQASEEAMALQAQMDELTKAWREKGVPLFKTYFKAISEAMQNLPELLNNGASRYISGNFTSLTFQITDAELDDFFRSKNPLFQNMSFRFVKGQFIAEGRDGETDVSIKGNYTVENNPENKLQFHVDELTFNGYLLPDTTNRSLEQEFDLGFAPEKYMPSIKATDVILDDGKLVIKLKMSLAGKK